MAAWGMLLLLMFGFAGTGTSQNAVLTTEDISGPDQRLYNGRKYAYSPPYGTDGHPFLQTSEFIQGQISLQGMEYTGLLLNLDVFNQQLLLQFSGKEGAVNTIEVSKAWIEHFSLGSKYFGYTDAGDGLRFYQIIGNGPVRVFWYFSKRLEIKPGSNRYMFSGPQKTAGVMKDGVLTPYKSKKGFLSVVGNDRQEVRAFLRKHRIRVMHASDAEMTVLLDFINTRQ